MKPTPDGVINRVIVGIINFFLLSCLLFQAVILLFFAGYGYIPIPKGVIEHFIKKTLPPELEVVSEAYHLTAKAEFVAKNLNLYLDSVESPIFSAENATLQFERLEGQNLGLRWSEAQVVNGTLYLPSIYSPSGQHTAILEKTSFAVSYDALGYNLSSFAAQHADIILRGAGRFPQSQKPAHTAKSVGNKVSLFFGNIAKLIREKSKLEALQEPTIVFEITTQEPTVFLFATQILSREVRYDGGTISNFSIDADLALSQKGIETNSSVYLKAEKIHLPDLLIETNHTRGLIEKDQWVAFHEDGKPPSFSLAASHLRYDETRLNHALLQVDASRFPTIKLKGYSKTNEGSLSFSGEMDPYLGAGLVDLEGNGPTGSFLSSLPFSDRLNSISTDNPLYFQGQLVAKENFKFQTGNFFLHLVDLSYRNLNFNTVSAKGTFEDGSISIRDILILRDRQWIELHLNYEIPSKEYALTLLGEAIPTEYNGILPRWWTGIFKDFEFDTAHNAFGDFVIYGTAGERAARMYFGNAQASNATYKDVPIQQAQMKISGRGAYCELMDIQIEQANGWVTGGMKFSSRLDGIRQPESVRLDLDARLKLEDIKKIVDQNTQRVLKDFHSSHPLEGSLVAAIFSPSYPERAGQSFLDLSLQIEDRIRYQKMSAEDARLRLFGRDQRTFLRELDLGFLGGRLKGSADIFTNPQDVASLLLDVEIKGASQNSAQQLFGSSPQKSDSSNETDGEFELQLHAIGPISDPYTFQGYGNFSLSNNSLASIQLFGPVSRILERAQLGYTTFALEAMHGSFQLQQKQLEFTRLDINGPRTRIGASGSLDLLDQALDMQVTVYLFGNVGDSESTFRKLSDFITKPIPNLLQFELTGTLEEQQWRSLYDPRSFMPQL